jgi:competence protein ComFC
MKPVASTFSTYRKSIIDILFPLQCVQCKKKLDYESAVSGFVCPACWETIEIIRKPYCLRCGHPAGDGFSDRCEHCKRFKKVYFSLARGVAKYKDPLRKVIHYWKYEYYQVMETSLSPLLQNYLSTHTEFDEMELIIPVPLHWLKYWRREFNQAEKLAIAASQRLRLPINTDLLYRARYNSPQMKLSPEQRYRNVFDLFAVRSPEEIKNKRILLLDDVMTTGATVNACAQVLMESGAQEVRVLVLARG